MKALLVLVALIGLAKPAQTTTLTQVCRSFCGQQLGACFSKRCTRALLSRCRRDGPGFCLQELCTPSPGATTTTTTTTTTQPDAGITLRVNSVEHSSDSDGPYLVVHFTLSVSPTAVESAHINALDFHVTQSGIAYEWHYVYPPLPDDCALVSVNPGASYTCGLAFSFQDNGSPRMFTYDGISSDQHASVMF